MSLKKKIAVSFLISAFIIAILAAFEYINFIEIKKEIRNLELTDTIRSKSLQLRRHEKNFFLYGMPKAAEESYVIHKYLNELDAIVDREFAIDKTGRLSYLKKRIKEYGERFDKIESSVKDLTEEFEKTKDIYARYQKFFPLIESTFLERPHQASEFLEKIFLLPSNHRLVMGLRDLYSDIQILRKDGEDIIIISKELDKAARDNAERFIRMSQIAILIVFPLFFIVGIGMLFIISSNVVNRLRLLINIVGKTGKGDYSHIPVSSQKDEVGILIREFNDMENQLSQREVELDRKNKELLQSKKLAAIGTLASGVAHELNNPLNNIYISAQVLMREAGDSCSLMTRETVNDILGQTLRVKRIVGDLLEFARGKEPQLREVELNELLMGAYKLVSTTTNTEDINFMMDTDPAGVIINADHEQMERVFINLFINAVDAMSGKGNLTVNIKREDESAKIRISDTGKGMSADAVEKIFEPFYTTKDKGTGLGLAIVFNIIKKHNGEIKVESEEGRGTTFIITLPARKEDSDI
jgi:two-component system NtrC family sensor kinase